jgi:hypothetical protein
VLAATVLATKLSKFVPPLTAVIARLSVPASTYTSSLGAATATVALVAPLAIVIVAPPAKVTVTASVALLVSVAVYVICPPSDTVGVALKLTVVVSIVSVTVVLAATVLATNDSKLVPPLTAVIARLPFVAPSYTSSPTATVVVALVAPLAIVIV